MPKDQDFKKYESKGAYHWEEYERGLLRRNVGLHARYNIVMNILEKNNLLKNGKGLDIGTGDGVFLFKVKSEGGQIEGLDNSKEGIKLAKKELAARGVEDIKIIRSSCYNTPYSNNSFDYVTAIELIEHLEDPKSFLSEVHRILKPSGLFICTTPNRYKEQGLDEVQDKYHYKEYITEEFRDLLDNYLEQVQIFGAYPNFLHKMYSNNKNSKMNYFRYISRVFVRLLSTVYNPFEEVKSDPGFDRRLLIGVGQKSSRT